MCKFINQFYLKACAIIHNSRSIGLCHTAPGEPPTKEEPTKAAKWFMLSCGECPTAMRLDLEPWTSQQPGAQLRIPFVIEVYSKDGGPEVLLERWTVTWQDHGADGALVNHNDETQVYKNLTLAARGLYYHLRLLPAHQIVRSDSPSSLRCLISKSSIHDDLSNKYAHSEAVNCQCGAGSVVVTVDYLQHIPWNPSPSRPLIPSSLPVSIIPNYLSSQKTTASHPNPKFSPTSSSPSRPGCSSSPSPSPKLSPHHRSNTMPHPATAMASLGSSLGRSFGALAAAMNPSIPSSPTSLNWMQRPPRTPLQPSASPSPSFSPTNHSPAPQASAAAVSTAIGNLASSLGTSLGRAGGALISSSPTSRLSGFFGTSLTSLTSSQSQSVGNKGLEGNRVEEDSASRALATVSALTSPQVPLLSTEKGSGGRYWMGQDFRAFLPPPVVEALTLPLIPSTSETLPLPIPITHMGFEAPSPMRRPLSPQLEAHSGILRHTHSTNSLALHSAGSGGGLLAQSIREHTQQQTLLTLRKAEEKIAEDKEQWIMKQLAPLMEAKDRTLSIGLFLDMMDEIESKGGDLSTGTYLRPSGKEGSFTTTEVAPSLRALDALQALDATIARLVSETSGSG